MLRNSLKPLRRLFGPNDIKPMRLLTWAVLMNLILLPVIAFIVWSMYHSFSSMGTDELRLQRLVGNVTHLNEVLAMSARMSAATGDPRWEERYRAIEPQLDEAITQTALLAREEYERNYAAQTKLAYTKLIETESLALSLVRAGREKEASALLFSPEYDLQQALYSQGLSAMADAVEQRIANEIKGFRKHLLEVGLLGFISFAILPLAWSSVWLVVKGHFKKRKQAEEALGEEKERLSVTLRSIGEGVITTDVTGKVVMMNRAAELLTGWVQQEAAGKALGDVFNIIDQKTGQRADNPGDAVHRRQRVDRTETQMVLVAKDGTRRTIAQTYAPLCDPDSNFVGVVVVFRDITEQEALEQEVARAEKLESLGILAGGIAHDFNNFLTAILGNISLAKLKVPSESKVLKLLSEAEKASMKATHLTRQLLTFAKGGSPIRSVASVKELLIECSTFALRGSNALCDFDIDPKLWPAEIDTGQISRVISNLVMNGGQAMPNGGIIHIRAQNYISENDGSVPLRPGPCVKISVTDQGEGIPPEHLNRIFDPYFTTKAKGTGLGLTMAYLATKKHNGHISVTSQVGVGTTFSVFLPACPEQQPQETSIVYAPRNGTANVKILVMDDDDAVRELAADMLKFLGYEVCVVADGTEAVRVYETSKKCGQPFDAVIMDLTVPGGMGGAEAIGILRSFDPDIRAIVSSGYSNGPIMGDYEKYGFCGVLCKPYSAEHMREVICRVINGRHENSMPSINLPARSLTA